MKNKNPLILIAEDTPDILMVLIDLLEMEGFRVHTSGDGQGAWEYLMHCHRCPDLVITDIMMPRLSGIDLIKKCREEEKFKNLPIMVYSSSAHFYKTVKNLGCEFISKPFDMDTILNAINNILNKENDLCDAIQN